MANCVEKESTISIHFSLNLGDMTPVDGTELDQPMTFSIGDGTMIPALEDVILGMHEGETRQVRLPPREAFGFPEENNYHWMAKDKFEFIEDQESRLTVGMMIEFDTENNEQVPGIIKEIQADKVLLDFNHPLAGHELNFSVQLVQIHASNNETIN